MTDVLRAGRTAVITGASSGIGKAAAYECANRGMHVWLVDVDADELVAAARGAASGEGQNIQSRVVDVSDEAAMKALANEVFQDGGNCHFLMNNAGVGSGGGALTEMSTMEKTLGINTFGPIHGCLAFLPTMKERSKDGEPCLIINTGSKQGITMPPGNLTYNMSKAALKCYTEGLEHELRGERAEGKHSIRAGLLIPGWVNTSILLKEKRRSAKEQGDADFKDDSVFFYEDKPASGAWMPQQVVDFMVSELDLGRFYIVCPDNDVDRETDNLRMTWTMQDITENRAPLSRWHPDYKDDFSKFLEENKSK